MLLGPPVDGFRILQYFYFPLAAWPYFYHTAIRFYYVILTTYREAELSGLLAHNAVFYLGFRNLKFRSIELRS
jgi:hypothetical protein